MNKVNNLNVLIFGVVLFSCTAKSELKIYPIPKSEFIDTITTPNKISFIKIRYFIIAGTIPHREGLLKFVDSFAAHNYDDSLKKFHEYKMMFYQESNETNLSNIQKKPRKLDDAYAQLHDLKLTYTWTGGGMPFREEFEQGEIINKGGKLQIKDSE